MKCLIESSPTEALIDIKYMIKKRGKLVSKKGIITYIGFRYRICILGGSKSMEFLHR